MFLMFTHSGKIYKVNDQGFITIGNMSYSEKWQFLGVSLHHWRRGIDINWKSAMKNPRSIVGGLVWDVDHGIVRKWGGMYNGKLPRITSAWTWGF